jgi:hypothetical protein
VVPQLRLRLCPPRLGGLYARLKQVGVLVGKAQVEPLDEFLLAGRAPLDEESALLVVVFQGVGGAPLGLAAQQPVLGEARRARQALALCGD